MDKSDTVVVSFGRANPPHKGHELLIDTVLDISNKRNAVPRCYWSESESNNKNPLSYKDKIFFLECFFGVKFKETYKPDKILDTFSIIKLMEREGFRHIIFVCGSDRIEEYSRRFKQYNGTEYHFDSMEVIQCGLFRDKEDNTSGLSSTKIRKTIKENNIEEFKKLYSWCNSKSLINTLYSKLKRYYDTNTK